MTKPLLPIAFAALILSSGTGCGFVSSIVHPDVAWAADEHAPVEVVERRAEVAARTADEVDRLLSATPSSEGAEWVKAVGPDHEVADLAMESVRAQPVYATTGARIVAAEVWAYTLPRVTSDGGDRPSFLAVLRPSVAGEYLDVMAKARDLSAIEAKAAAEHAAADHALPFIRGWHNRSAAELDAKASKLQAELDGTLGDLLSDARDAACKVDDDEQRSLAVAVVNLEQAVHSADVANRAAQLGAPAGKAGAVVRAKVRTTERELAIEQDLLEHIERGFNPNGVAEMPSPTRIADGAPTRATYVVPRPYRGTLPVDSAL